MRYSKPVAPRKPDGSASRTLRSALTVAVPTTALPSRVTVRGSPSTSRSLARTSRLAAPAVVTARKSFAARGGSFTAVTVIVAVAFTALFAGSVTRTPKLSVPKKSALPR